MDDYKGYQTKRQRLESLKGQMKLERQSFEPTWQDCSDFILPTRARFYTSDTNKGERRNQKIINSTATLAANTLAAGMMSGVTSPARPWFRLTTPQPDLLKLGPVKRWLHDVCNIMNTSFLRSNLYNVLPIVYGDMGTFGTAAMLVEEEFTGKVLKCKSLPIGSYMVAQDADGKVNTFCRTFKYTVAQIVEVFSEKDDKGRVKSWDNVSAYVQRMFKEGQTQALIEITHIIEPNAGRNNGEYESKFSKYYSCYYESSGNSEDAGKSEVYLSEKGFDYFPVLVPRWKVTGEDVYGTSCPGIDSLGDIKQLQLGEKRTLEAIEKMIDPPMVGPSSMKGRDGKLLPGSYHAADSRDGKAAIYPAYQIQFDVNGMEMKNKQVENRINEAFFKNLFLSFATAERVSGTTAAEVYEIKDEKLLALGPVLEQLNQDLLDDLIDIAYMFHAKQGLIPPPPQELHNVQLKVEYVSIMAQAQKSVGIGALERFSGFIGQAMVIDPSIVQKFNSDAVADLYADAMSVPPGAVRTDEEVAIIRQEQAKQAKMQQQMAMIQQGAGAVKDLAGAQMGGGEESALDRVVAKVGGG